MEKALSLPTFLRAGYCDFEYANPGVKQSPERTAKHFEFELPTEKGGLAFVNKKAYEVVPEIFLSITPGVTRHTKPPYKCLYIHFEVSDGEIKDLLCSLNNVIELSNTSKTRKLMQKVIDSLCTAEDNCDKTIGLFANFLSLLYHVKKEQDNHVLAKSLDPVKSAIAYIDEHFTEKLTLIDLAEATKYNPVYLHRIFKNSTGVTPADYILDKKIEYAKKLICYSGKSIKQISYEIGFNSPAYFNYVFKKQTGLSPIRYKRNYFKNYIV